MTALPDLACKNKIKVSRCSREGGLGGKSNYIIGILVDFDVQLADFFHFGEYFFSIRFFLEVREDIPQNYF